MAGYAHRRRVKPHLRTSPQSGIPNWRRTTPKQNGKAELRSNQQCIFCSRMMKVGEQAIWV